MSIQVCEEVDGVNKVSVDYVNQKYEMRGRKSEVDDAMMPKRLRNSNINEIMSIGSIWRGRLCKAGFLNACASVLAQHQWLTGEAENNTA